MARLSKEEKKKYYQEHKESWKKYYQEHKESIKKYQQERNESGNNYYQTHKEQISKKSKERRANDTEFREKERVKRLNYKEKNPEKVRAWGRESAARPKGKARQKKYYVENKEKISAQHKAYIKADPTRLVRFKDIREKKVKSRLVLGLCCHCLTPRLPDSNIYCEKHWFMSMVPGMVKLKGIKWTERPTGYMVEMGKLLKEKLEYQKYTCPYTGRKLVMALNTSLDHIISKSKRPDLAGSIENVQFVDGIVNFGNYILDSLNN